MKRSGPTLRLDRDAAWAEIAAVIENAYLTRAPKTLGRIVLTRERRVPG